MDGSATGGPWGGVKGFGFGESYSVVFVMYCYMVFYLDALYCTVMFSLLFCWREYTEVCCTANGIKNINGQQRYIKRLTNDNSEI